MVRALDRAFRILDVLSEVPTVDAVTLRQKTGLPKSTLYELLSSLEELGAVIRTEDNRYSLGLRLVEFGEAARERLRIREIAAPYLQHLSEQFDETIHLTVLDRDEVLYVDCFESSRRFRTYSVIGVRAPLHCTAVGKAILAEMDTDNVERLLQERPLERFTETTITGIAEMREELVRTRERGYSIDEGEHEPGIRCIGAAITGKSGQPYASISVSGPVQRMSHEKLPDMAAQLRNAATEISTRLGRRT